MSDDKKKGETGLSIEAWTIAELERWPPPPHATMSLFIYPVHHAAFPVTTGGGSRPHSAEVGAVRLIHCKWHLPAWFVMFPDATRKAWLVRNYGPDAAFILFVYPFRYTVIPQKLCHWCSERGLAQKMWLMKGLCNHYRCNPFKIKPRSEQNNRNEARLPDDWSSHKQPHNSLRDSHPLPFYIIPLQIDKGTREPTGTVIQYWNLTVSDQIWWTVILSSLPWPDGLQYRSAPSERSVSHCSLVPPRHHPSGMNEGIDERLGFERRD